MTKGRCIRINEEWVKVDSWIIFNEMFKPGEDVVIIDEEDNFWWGSIVAAVHTGLVLKTLRPPDKLYLWEDIRFIAHDGFPVKKLMGSRSDKYIQQAFDPEIPKLVRNALTLAECGGCHSIMDREQMKKHKAACLSKPKARSYSYGGGCPWIIENVLSTIINIGNSSEYFQYEDDRFIETVIMQSVDGASGLLWDLASLFHFEVACFPKQWKAA